MIDVAARTVIVQVEPGILRTGMWCNACMTSGGFHLPLHRICDHGVTTVAVAVGCFTCEGPGDLEP